MAHEKVYGFCENKCKVPVAPKTETDAFDSRITAFEDNISFDSNGNIVGNVAGKINVSSCATSGDIRILQFTYSNPSIEKAGFSTSYNSLLIPKVTDITPCTTSVFNYTGDISSINVTNTCTIKVAIPYMDGIASSYKCDIILKDNTLNTTVMSVTGISVTNGNSSSKTFDRDSTHDYILQIKWSTTNNNIKYNVTIDTPVTYTYIPLL